MASCAPPRDVLGQGCLASSGARCGPRGEQLACQSLPSSPPVRRAPLVACYGPPLRVPWRAGGQGGGGGGWLGPGSGGRCPLGAHPGPLARTLLPPSIWGPAHWAPGRRIGLRERSPCCQRRRRRVVRCCRGEEGGWPGVLGCLERWPGPAVRDQWSACQRDSIAAWVCVFRPVRVRPPGRIPPPRVGGLCGLQDRGLRPSPICPAERKAEGGGGARGWGARACRERAPRAVGPPPSSLVLTIWGPRLGLAGAGPLPSGSAVLSASFWCGGSGFGRGGFLGP